MNSWLCFKFQKPFYTHKTSIVLSAPQIDQEYPDNQDDNDDQNNQDDQDDKEYQDNLDNTKYHYYQDNQDKLNYKEKQVNYVKSIQVNTVKWFKPLKIGKLHILPNVHW